MSISYGLPHHTTRGSGVQSSALNNYASLCESMREDNNDLMSVGVIDVMSNKVAFAGVVEQLTEGLTEDARAEMEVLMENTRKDVLQETFNSGVHPITALSLPMLRVGYPKLAVREGLPTEPVEQPKFKVTTKRPYVVDPATNTKHYLPAAFRTQAKLFGLPQLETTPIAATSGAIVNYDLLTPIQKNAALGDEIDADFSVVEIEDDTGVKYPVEIRLDTNNNVLAGSVKDSTGAEVMQVFGSVDRAKGRFTLTSVGGTKKLAKAAIQGFISSEANNATTRIGFDITGEDIVVGTGQPIESPINIQAMNDAMNSYKLDVTMANLEIMSTALAQTIDLKGINFLEQSFAKDPSVVETFDVRPAAGYALGDTQWREELKIKFDRLVTRLQERTNIYSGRAVIFAHPLDAQVVTNIRWAYTREEQPNSVAVSHRLGSFSSSVTNYTLLQSPYFKQGEMIVLFIPDDPEHRTSTYFPYSFNTIRGAASPSMPNIPSIQMIQRSIFKTFTPMLGKVKIQNNGV